MVLFNIFCDTESVIVLLITSNKLNMHSCRKYIISIAIGSCIVQLRININ